MNGHRLRRQPRGNGYQEDAVTQDAQYGDRLGEGDEDERERERGRRIVGVIKENTHRFTEFIRGRQTNSQTYVKEQTHNWRN